MVYSDTYKGDTVVTLMPNRSASWVQTRLMLLLICGITLAIGVLWAVVGAWLILPFSGLEALLVAYVLYTVCHATYQRQVITCSPHRLLVQTGAHFPKRSWSLDRSRAHIAVTDPRHELDPIGLRLVDQEHSIEIGKFLNREDRAEALRVLRAAGLHMRSSNPDSVMEP